MVTHRHAKLTLLNLFHHLQQSNDLHYYRQQVLSRKDGKQVRYIHNQPNQDKIINI